VIPYRSSPPVGLIPAAVLAYTTSNSPIAPALLAAV